MRRRASYNESMPRSGEEVGHLLPSAITSMGDVRTPAGCRVRHRNTGYVPASQSHLTQPLGIGFSDVFDALWKFSLRSRCNDLPRNPAASLPSSTSPHRPPSIPPHLPLARRAAVESWYIVSSIRSPEPGENMEKTYGIASLPLESSAQQLETELHGSEHSQSLLVSNSDVVKQICGLRSPVRGRVSKSMMHLASRLELSSWRRSASFPTSSASSNVLKPAMIKTSAHAYDFPLRQGAQRLLYQLSESIVAPNLLTTFGLGKTLLSLTSPAAFSLPSLSLFRGLRIESSFGKRPALQRV